MERKQIRPKEPPPPYAPSQLSTDMKVRGVDQCWGR